MKRGILAMAMLACVAGVVGGAGNVSATISIDTVPVGNASNPTDTATGNIYGSVTYTYNIGKYEVTAGQYTAFLNAVAATDTYGLYNTLQAGTSLGSGIARSGSAGSYTYSVNSAFIDRPVNCVSFWDACRFTNWLDNGQPIGQEVAGTTETGAYILTTTGINANSITRNTGAIWAVASENEWYKAAYYNPATSSYYLYPTSNNTMPGRDVTDASGNNANYYNSGSPFPLLTGNYTTLAGEFQNSASPYGTFDQGGNVSEWTEAKSGSMRYIRGGSFNYHDYFMDSAYRVGTSATGEDEYTGFRVVEIPEPASLALLSLGVAGLLRRRRGARQCRKPVARASGLWAWS